MTHSEVLGLEAVLKNCHVVGSRTALFFKRLKFFRSAENFFLDGFYGDRQKKNFEDLFFEIA